MLNSSQLAEQRARFVGGLYACAITTGLDNILPSTDELVAACLAAMLVTLAEVMAVGDWGFEAIDTMRRLRQAKNLVNATDGLPRGRDQKSSPNLTGGSDSSPG